MAHQRALDTAEALKAILKGRVEGQGIGHKLVLELAPKPTAEAAVEVVLGVESRSCSRAHSQSHPQSSSQSRQPRPPNGPLPGRRVTFRQREVRLNFEGSMEDYSSEPSISDVEIWLEWQAQ